MKGFGIALLLWAIACGSIDAQNPNQTRPVTNDAHITYCVGRNVIDMPPTFLPGSVTVGSFKAMEARAQGNSFDVVVRSGGLTSAQFAAEVARRRAELKDGDDGTVDVVRLEKALSAEATLFRVQRIKDAYISEIISRRGGSLVTVKLKSYDNRFAAAEESLVKFMAAMEEQKDAPARVDGFCLGPVIINGRHADEQGSFSFKDGKGNVFDIKISPYTGDTAVPLLARMAAPDSLLARFDLGHTVLRAGERTIAGTRAQEWLGRTKLGADTDEKSFGFALETMRPAPGTTPQRITVSFDTARPLDDGSESKTILSNEAAMRLWDTVMQSIRLAPPRGSR